MHPSVQKLLALQKVDQQIASLRKDIDSLPAEEARRRRRLDDLDKVRTERKEALARAEVDVRTMDKTIKQSDDEVKKLTDRLNVVRNNAEYQAILFQIESVKKERDQTQERCLELIEQLDGLREAAEAAAKAADAERQVFDEFLAEAEKLRAERGEAVRAVETRRQGLADGVPPEVLEDYTTLFRTRNGMAVAAVENRFCQGCYTQIITNDLARLMGGSSIVTCGSCQRILYLAK